MKFLFFTEFGETADLAAYLQDVEGHDVTLFISDKKHHSIAQGILDRTDAWWQYLGRDYIWFFDSCAFGNLQDWLRLKGEAVCGSSELCALYESNRQKGQDWFADLGFEQPYSKNFTNIEAAITFVEKRSDQRWILKQNGDAPKHLSHMGKFAQSEDMLFHLREMAKGWNVQEFGPIDFDLMEVVEGTEVAASGFFNGKDWLRDPSGRVVGFLNFEEKKEGDGNTGETCGEMGTTFLGCTEDNELFASILRRPGISETLASTGFRGVFDINCILADDGRLVALEPTCRPGIPATSYEFIEGMDSEVGDLISAMAHGIGRKVNIHEGIGMVMCVVAKPFPLDVDVEPDGTSVGEKLWILENGEPIEDFTPEQRRHIHLYNFERSEDDETGEVSYKVPTKNGYLLTVTARGETIESTRNSLIDFLKGNLYISGMKYRTDIGKRAEEFVEEMTLAGHTSRD